VSIIVHYLFLEEVYDMVSFWIEMCESGAGAVVLQEAIAKGLVKIIQELFGQDEKIAAVLPVPLESPSVCLLYNIEKFILIRIYVTGRTQDDKDELQDRIGKEYRSRVKYTMQVHVS